MVIRPHPIAVGSPIQPKCKYFGEASAAFGWGLGSIDFFVPALGVVRIAVGYKAIQDVSMERLVERMRRERHARPTTAVRHCRTWKVDEWFHRDGNYLVVGWIGDFPVADAASLGDFLIVLRPISTAIPRGLDGCAGCRFRSGRPPTGSDIELKLLSCRLCLHGDMVYGTTHISEAPLEKELL